MARPPRINVGGVVYHVLNRAVAGVRIFQEPADFNAFERVMAEGLDVVPMRVLSYCVMPSHWHMVLYPREDGDLSQFVGRLTLTHAKRWHGARGTTGAGHLYQGRFKSFPVQTDQHFLIVCRYVERNPLTAGLVERAEEWPWSSLGTRETRGSGDGPTLAPWPVPRPRHWVKWVNDPPEPSDLKALGACSKRGRPFGKREWADAMAERLGLQSTLRRRGRPRNRR